MKQDILIFITLFLGITVMLGGIAFIIYIYTTYGNMPLKDLPAWVLPFFQRGK